MSESDETGGGSFFNQFANAMIERSLPAIREWLRSRLGPRASLGEVSVEGVRITVRNARVPLGVAVLLAVDEATLLARPEGFVAGRAAARLEQLRGTVRFERGALTTLEAPVEIEATTSDDAAWVNGELRLAGATWRPTRGVGEAMPLEGTAQLRITAESWTVREAKLKSGGSEIRGWASGALGGEVLRSGELEVERARLGHTLDVLEAFSGRALKLPVPVSLDALVDVKGALGGGRLNASVELTTERSRARLSFERAASGAIKDGQLEGEVHPEELLPEAWQRFVEMETSAPLVITGNGEGPADALEGTLTVRAQTLQLRGQREASPANALVALRGAAGLDFDLTLEGAGRAFGHARLRPEAIDGNAQVRLEPGAWALGERRLEGDPVTLALTLAGRRSAPTVDATLEGPRVELRRQDRPPLVLRRVRGSGRFAEGALSGLSLDARVGPGRIRVTPHGGGARVQVDRVDREDLIAFHDLVFTRRWLGRTPDDARFVVPEDAQAWADVTLVGPELEGTLHVEAPRSRLSFAPLSVNLQTGATDGTTARAILGYDDARAIGLFQKSRLLPLGPGAAELGATLTGAGRSMRLFVSGRARELGLGNDADVGPDFMVENVRARFVLDAGGLEVQQLTGQLFGGRFDVRGALRSGAVSLERAQWLASGPSLRRRLLPDLDTEALEGLAVRLDISGTEAGLLGKLDVRTDRSTLRLNLETEGTRFVEDGSQLAGSVDPVDLGGLLDPVALSTEAPVGVIGRLRGSWEQPEGTLELVGGPGRVAVAMPGSYRSLPFDELTAHAAITRARSHVGATLHGLAGGRASVEAALLTARPTVGTLGVVTIEDVDVGVASDEVGGKLTGRAVGWRLAGTAPGARASATLARPRYAILKRLEPLLERYGLRAPPPDGLGPASVALRLDRGALAVFDLEAAIEGLRVTGGVQRSAEGEWGGEVRLEAAEAWLRTSRLLGRPARWLGDLVVPIRVRGTDGALRAEADVLATLDRALGKTRFGQGVQRAIDRVLEELFSREPPPEPAADHHAASDVTTSDALIDRVARGDRDADRALGTLLERGLSPRELAEQITRRRARDL